MKATLNVKIKGPIFVWPTSPIMAQVADNMEVNICGKYLWEFRNSRNSRNSGDSILIF
jgi:hypothetical protein